MIELATGPRQQPILRPGKPVAPPAGAAPSAPRPALVTVVGGYGGDLPARLQQAGIPVVKALPWGSNKACRVLLDSRPPMILLDLHPSVVGQRLADFVQAAALIAPVVVLRHEGQSMLINLQGQEVLLRPSGQETLEAFRAGAFDVVDPGAPPAELAARIKADLRRCPAVVEEPGPRWRGGSSPSQRLLFDLIARAHTPICCHYLKQLLGTAREPLTLRALRARVHRLLPVFDAYGLSLVVDQWRGIVTYRVDSREASSSQFR
ncbi:hypothetical protein BX265_6930 [Streptomyces sp. TLI_235]|nr:hypothetical protein [Streptomyces sp. TLI_235]PBC69599.1 hypothetical protein BX265_6930 [Streptomyces sp. TLI_235]